MNRQIRSSSLAVTLSTKGVCYLRGCCIEATLAGVDGLDVDATTALGRWLAARLAASEVANVPIRTLWLPASFNRLQAADSFKSLLTANPMHVRPS